MLAPGQGTGGGRAATPALALESREIRTSTLCEIVCFGVKLHYEMSLTLLFSTLLQISAVVDSQQIGRILFWGTMLVSHNCVMAVCPHCGNSVEGGAHCGTGGATCPLHIGITHNVALLASGDLTGAFKTTHLMPRDMQPLFSKGVQDQILGIYSAPRDGSSVDLTGSSYATPRAVTQAYVNGHCSYNEALLELGDRLQACSTSVEIEKCNGAISLLKANGEDFVNNGVDVHKFIWARICSKFATTQEVILRQADTTKRIAQTFIRPKTERQFYEAITYYIFIVSLLGITIQIAAIQFFRDVVYSPINRNVVTWMEAHEYMLIYWRAIAEDATRKLTLANVYEGGKQDTYLTEARANAVTFFRPPAQGQRNEDEEPPKTVGEKKYTGKFDSSAVKPCLSFNYKTKHQAKHLDANGCCKFNHFCMQWVSDKGPRGMCGGSHPKADCPYDASKKLDKPLP